MELALSLGNMGTPLENNNTISTTNMCIVERLIAEIKQGGDDDQDEHDRVEDGGCRKVDKVGSSSSSDRTAGVSPRQLDLLPFSPVAPRPSLRFPWLSDNLSSEPGSSDGLGPRIPEMNRQSVVCPTAEDGDGNQSSPNSGTSSFMEFSLYTSNNNNNNNNNNNHHHNNGGGVKRRGDDHNGGVNNEGGSGGGGNDNVQGVIIGGGELMERGGTTSRGSDDEENGSTRKKLRLSKEQSAFLEESFKEHHTLNPKQKQALAKELNLRPRQVEVWFQNRRARTKLKQTEVDCEYLKRCCETLTEENRRLQKELHELRALKTSQPFFMQRPPTTLTMCPSCERVAPTSTSSAISTGALSIDGSIATASDNNNNNGIVTLSLGKPVPSDVALC